MCLLLGISCLFAMAASIRVGEFFYKRNNLKLLAQLSVFSINTLRTGLLNCLNARSRGLIQSEVRFL